MKDFNEIIMPGITHWQNPNFFAYFPANTSPASILAEMITATLGAQCMIWETSPAAAELEEKMMIWLRDLIGFPQIFRRCNSGFSLNCHTCSDTYSTGKKQLIFQLIMKVPARQEL